jgi:ABC-type branched-subunit amino acid transport system substrate-binding protein
MQEVMLEYYNWQTLNDMTPTILKMKQLNPDVVHHISFSNDGVLFWRQAKEQNFLFKALVHAGATGYGSSDFGKALGNDANGVFALLEPGRASVSRPSSPKASRSRRPSATPSRRRPAATRSAPISSPAAGSGSSSSCSTKRSPTIPRSSAPP